MGKFEKPQPVRRLEGQRFLTGRGRYVDDIAPNNALHAVFVRSQVAHGNLSPVDLTEARAMPGVHLALAAEDLEARGIDFIMHGTRVTNRDGFTGAETDRRILAKGKVRFVGDPIAICQPRSMSRPAARPCTTPHPTTSPSTGALATKPPSRPPSPMP